MLIFIGMRIIELTRGRNTIVDDSDYELLINYKWTSTGSNGSYYAYNDDLGFMHRYLMNLSNGQSLVDHKDGDSLNNQRHNLRLCTHRQNMCNRKSMKNSTSKYLGVFWEKARSKWVAQISINNKLKKLGYFKTELEAGILYNKASRK